MDADLEALAEAYGVATWYEDWHRKRKDVAAASVVAVLGLLGVDAGTPQAIAAALRGVRERDRLGRLPGTVVVRSGSARKLPGPAVIVLEDGERRDAPDGVPADLPLGWHRLLHDDQDVTLVVVPTELPAPPDAWGWMVQLYALHSAGSWGMGDLRDLRDFVARSGDPELILLNPLQAITPTLPVPASPYAPSSRRFANPLYLRVEDTDEYRRADPAVRAEVDAFKPPLGDRIDYTRVWQAKRAALEHLWPLAGEIDLAADPGLTDFARFCALAERHGPDWQQWPDELRRPDSPAVRSFHSDRVGFHVWLQHLLDQQLAAANETAREHGMTVGVVHDLPVSADPHGADGWLLQDVLAAGARAGAPPDAFNQLGQDWGSAVWRPDTLIESGYAAYRDMLRRIFRYAGGLRVDHVAGLWRIWWVPPGMGAAEGTYVRYDPEAMLGILALEAHRAGAVVIGEDLGTVQPEVTKGLERTNMLSSAVLYFTRDWEDPDQVFYPAAAYPRNALATVSTHDLPTAAGYLAAEQVKVRAKLGQLAGTEADERRTAAKDRAELEKVLRAEGLITAGSSDDEIIVAMHEFLARTPCRFVTASLYDVLGELDQPNLPGTVDEYPNWRMPLRLSLEQIADDPRIRRVAEILANRTKGARPMSFLDKAKDFLDKHDEQVDQALEKAGDEIDKRTGSKYSAHIDKGVDEAQRRTGEGDTRP
jgi:4-alpha-glucanotransferase